MAAMALRYGLRRCAAAKSLKASLSPVIRGSTNLTGGTTTNSVPADTWRRFEWNLLGFHEGTSGFPKFVMADEPPPADKATMRLKTLRTFLFRRQGFGIDVDLGDDGYIRPFHGSLDDPKVTGPAARFVVDTYNSSEGYDDIEQLFAGSYSGLVNLVREPQRDPYVLSCASFAVEEYNKNKDKQLQLVKVVEANKKFGDGVLYDLTIEVAGDDEKLYHARVWLLHGEKELINFGCVENLVDAVMPA